jgi:hypothetical protein
MNVRVNGAGTNVVTGPLSTVATDREGTEELAAWLASERDRCREQMAELADRVDALADLGAIVDAISRERGRCGPADLLSHDLSELERAHRIAVIRRATVKGVPDA